jgi:hypothetical protein
MEEAQGGSAVIPQTLCDLQESARYATTRKPVIGNRDWVIHRDAVNVRMRMMAIIGCCARSQIRHDCTPHVLISTTPLMNDYVNRVTPQTAKTGFIALLHTLFPSITHFFIYGADEDEDVELECPRKDLGDDFKHASVMFRNERFEDVVCGFREAEDLLDGGYRIIFLADVMAHEHASSHRGARAALDARCDQEFALCSDAALIRYSMPSPCLSFAPVVLPQGDLYLLGEDDGATELLLEKYTTALQTKRQVFDPSTIDTLVAAFNVDRRIRTCASPDAGDVRDDDLVEGFVFSIDQARERQTWRTVRQSGAGYGDWSNIPTVGQMIKMFEGLFTSSPAIPWYH